MKIKHINNEKNGYFQVVDAAGIQAGKMTYVWNGDTKFIIDHTEVNPDFKGQSVGKKMVAAAVEFARKNEVKIVPLCPFAKAVIHKIPEFQDVLV